MACYYGPKNDKIIRDMLVRGTTAFLSDPSYVNIDEYGNKPRVFVGDTHGDYMAIEKVIEKWPLDKYIHVLLGDYSDRTTEPLGSLINLLYITSLKLAHPKDLIVLRGNHESNDLEWDDKDIGNLVHALQKRFGNVYIDYLGMLEKMFSVMPYAAVSNNGIIALHGGIPDIICYDQIADIPKSITKMRQNPIAEQILWSDHNIYVDSHDENIRGCGIVYGHDFFTKKMKILGKNVLLRGHDHSLNGHVDFNNRILTLITSETYADRCGRIVAIDNHPDREVKTIKDLDIVDIDR